MLLHKNPSVCYVVHDQRYDIVVSYPRLFYNGFELAYLGE